MLIAINKLRESLGEEAWQRALALEQHGAVREADTSADSVTYLVNTTPPHRVMIHAGDGARCTCAEFIQSGGCAHLAMAAIHARRDGNLVRLEQVRATAGAPMLLESMDHALPLGDTLRLEVTLLRDSTPEGPRYRVGLRVGEEKLYAVRSVPLLIDAIEQGDTIDFGKAFTFHGDWMRFGPAEERVIQILRALFAAQRERIPSMKPPELRYPTLPLPFAEQLLEALTRLPFRFGTEEETAAMPPITTGTLTLRFKVSGGLRGLTVTGSLPRDFLPVTEDCAYVQVNGAILRVEEKQRALIHTLWQRQCNGSASFLYDMAQAPRVISELLPFLRLYSVVEMEPAVENMLEKLPLEPKLYLDRSGQSVVARVRFCYGDRSVNPFDETPPPSVLNRGEKLLLRDALAERRILDALGAAGFHTVRGSCSLSGSEKIYHFMTEGMGTLQGLCEIYASREFQKLAPRRPQLRGTLRMAGSHLELSLLEDEQPSEEILAIMEALAHRKDYFRLKDGTFLDLSALDEWQQVAETVTDAAAAESIEQVRPDGTLSFSTSRLYYMNSLLENSGIPIERDDAVKQTADYLVNGTGEEELPSDLDLRSYQQRGYSWLRTLDRLRMGGILADDMGLGKTVQMIALMKQIRRQEGHSLMLVVSPTSLTYNWLSELERFAPELSVMVMGGTGAQRLAQLAHIQSAGDVDVLITSYPLIRRDIEQLREIPFRLAVLDEAQQIKNAGSVGAVAVKQLKADSRFALTGTPMENSMGELWSIFDFVLPGYLGGYTQFMRRYQDGNDLDELRRRIRPFLMRRLKKDVLTELPDKQETVLNAGMTPEQEKVYHAAMLRLRDRVDRLMEEKGFGRSRTEVLSAMTELRQICCHPSLVMNNYAGSSGKLELLLDILPGSLMGGHRVLIFSQFTTMLRLLRRKLEDNGIVCLYLDGDTPPATRMELTERFNGGFGQVFLISLKAGGTGLNLTGADMVIHYDPWWNPAAEDQATDRAHRIGQTHKVSVLRLVTHDSIEEQVVALGERKKALFDQLITPGEQLVTALTEADIRGLFV